MDEVHQVSLGLGVAKILQIWYHASQISIWMVVRTLNSYGVAWVDAGNPECDVRGMRTAFLLLWEFPLGRNRTNRTEYGIRKLIDVTDDVCTSGS